MTEWLMYTPEWSDTCPEYGWQFAPVIVLEQVFTLLPRLSDRYSCSIVCRHWLNVFRCGRQWRHLVIGERTFTRRKFRAKIHRWAGVEGVPSTMSDDDGDPEYEVNHWRLQVYLGKFGDQCQRMSFKPITNYYNLFEFLRVISCYFEFFDEFPMPILDRFDFDFAAESVIDPERSVVGTGGQILNELRRTLSNIRSDLRTLTLNDLLLTATDASNLLDVLKDNCGGTLRYLELLNITRLPGSVGLQIVPRFTSLSQLTVSSTQLTDDELLVEIVSSCHNLERLTFVEDRISIVVHQQTGNDVRNTCILQQSAAVSKRLFLHKFNLSELLKEYITCVLAEMSCSAIHPETWRRVRQVSPHLRVAMKYRSKPLDYQLSTQTPWRLSLPSVEAPVDEVAYVDWPWSTVTRDEVCDLVERFSNTLTSYVHSGIHWRGQRSRSFDGRGDSALVMLVRQCRALRRLVIKERISTGTLIVLAAEGQSHLRELVVRRNAVVLKTDWALNDHWSYEFYQRLRTSSRSYDETEREISNLLHQCNWKMLPDKVFKRFLT